MEEQTLTVSLDPELRAFVDEHVASGSYASASAVIAEGLARMRAREEELIAFHVEKFRRAAAQVDAGEYMTSEQFEAYIKLPFEERQKFRLGA